MDRAPLLFMLILASCGDDGVPAAVWSDAPAEREPAAPFLCNGDHCEQSHPRLPDDGEWECFDQDGAVLCRGGEPPAGVVAGPPDASWRCGSLADGRRVCVDLGPDLPEGDARGWACRFDHSRGISRLCERDADAPGLGRPCPGKSPCVAGTRCSEGRCLPRRVEPACWFDTDCGAGRRCRFATCFGGAR